MIIKNMFNLIEMQLILGCLLKIYELYMFIIHISYNF